MNMLRIKDGKARITGFNGEFVPVNSRDRRDARKTLANAEREPLNGLGMALGMTGVDVRVNSITKRDSVPQRAALEPAYNKILGGLLDGKFPGTVAMLIREAKELRPEVFRPRAQKAVPEILGKIRSTLLPVVEEFHKTRYRTATAMRDAALVPDPLTDPAQAVARAVRHMEIRQRLAAMPQDARHKLVMEMGNRGDAEGLFAVADDPLGACVPAEILNAAREKALDAMGGRWLADDASDAAEELMSLAAMGDVMFNSVLAELKDSGVPEGLLRDSLGLTQWASAQTNK
jgi:hypothetical protein